MTKPLIPFQICSLLVTIGLFLSCSSSGRMIRTSTYYDEDGSEMKEADFLKKWRSTQNGVARWDSIENGERTARFSGSRYQQYIISYPAFKRNLERATGRDFDLNTIFLLEYWYRNDQCSSRYSNTWTKENVSERKRSLDPQKKQLEEKYPNLKFFHFFEEGISLATDPATDREYFFTDDENFLRETIFQNPSLCGSFAIVKPNGEVLIYNGEAGPETMVRLLEEENWKLFFGKE